MAERSVKISDDERGGWSSDRPRRDGRPPRPADVSSRCHVLGVTDRLRYSPGSLVIVASPSQADRERFAERVFEEKNAIISPVRVRALLAQKVSAEELDERVEQLLDAAVAKRLTAGDSVVVPIGGLDPLERERLVRAAHSRRRPRHLIFLDTAAPEEDRLIVNELRKRLDAGDLGEEGFQTALRLSAGAIPEVKRVVFRHPPRDDD